MTHEFICRQCNQVKRHESNLTTGYGEDKHGNKICFACCAKLDQGDMLREGRATLYLSKAENDLWRVTNWPGSLEFVVSYPRRGRHNIAGQRYDVWFLGPDNRVWHGVQYGEFTQICHVRRTREVTR